MTDYALVIGIDDYLEKPPGSLNGANEDAIEIARWLTDPNGGGLDKTNCSVITSAEDKVGPIRDQIEEKLKEIIFKARENPEDNNCLYFYFAGHGIGVELDVHDLDAKDNALCMANWSNIKRNAALSTRKYKNTFTSFGLFRQTVLWADCCRNTKMHINPLHSDLAPEKPGPHLTRYFIVYATQPRESSYETATKQGKTRGIFTTVLLEGLKGGAASPSGKIDSVSLGNYLKRYTPVEARNRGCFQDPQIIYDNMDAEPMILGHAGPPLMTNCCITLTPTRNIVLLLDNDMKVIKEMDRLLQVSFELKLPKGNYLLQEGRDKTPFEVNPIASKEDLIIKF